MDLRSLGVLSGTGWRRWSSTPTCRGTRCPTVGPRSGVTGVRVGCRPVLQARVRAVVSPVAAGCVGRRRSLSLRRRSGAGLNGRLRLLAPGPAATLAHVSLGLHLARVSPASVTDGISQVVGESSEESVRSSRSSTTASARTDRLTIRARPSARSRTSEPLNSAMVHPCPSNHTLDPTRSSWPLDAVVTSDLRHGEQTPRTRVLSGRWTRPVATGGGGWPRAPRPSTGAALSTSARDIPGRMCSATLPSTASSTVLSRRADATNQTLRTTTGQPQTTPRMPTPWPRRVDPSNRGSPTFVRSYVSIVDSHRPGGSDRRPGRGSPEHAGVELTRRVCRPRMVG